MFTISDPLSFTFLATELIFIVASIGFILASSKAKTEWGRATRAGFGISMLAIRTLAVLPSWWLYYADAKLKWGGNGCSAFDLQCLKQSIKDTIVVIENAVVLGAFVVGFVLYQKRFPKQLASGESKPEPTYYR